MTEPAEDRDRAERKPTPSRSELAEDRTDLAEDRTLLAHERSFAGWVRTGMAAVGIGVGFHALFPMIEPTWVPKAIASVFLMVAVFIFLSAERRACRAVRRLEAHRISELAPVRIRLMSWILVVTTAALGVAIWGFA